jgi:hypothetical protein
MEVACKSTNTMGVVGVQEVTFTSFQGTPNQCIHRFMRRIKRILRQVDDLHDVTLYIKALNLSNGNASMDDFHCRFIETSH